MKIKINGKPLKVASYDDDSNILQKYALMSKSLPSYFRFTDQNFRITPGIDLAVDDIRDELSKLTINEITENDTIKKLLNDYPNLNKQEVLMLWLHQHFSDSDQLLGTLSNYEDKFRKINRQMFYNVNEVVKLFREYPTSVVERVDDLQRIIKNQREIMTKLDDVDAPVPGKFDLEEITLLISMGVPNGTSLADVFDAFDASEDIPFLHLRYRGNDWYKIYSHFNIPDEWIEKDDSDGLFFKILNASKSKILTSKKVETLYSEGVWLENHNVEIEFNVNVEVGESVIRQKFFGAIANRIDYKILQEKQFSVKGKFSIENVLFNRIVFADMITNSKILSYFLFLNERVTSVKDPYNSVITRKRFSFYYEPNQDYTLSRALTILTTPYISEEDSVHRLDVRIMRAKNLQQVESFRIIFSKLLGVYLQEMQSVIDIYSKLLPSSTSEIKQYIKKPKTKKKIDLKSGRRLQELKSKRPGVFRSGYASMCQPMSHQPYIISTEKEAIAVRDKYGEHKIMEYVDPTTGKKDWYACEPREPGEEGIHIYPGLRANTSRTYPKYREEVPTIPCCFTEDQYLKPGALLHKKLQSAQLESVEIAEESSITEASHVLASNKRVPFGRFGQIPYYLSFIAKDAGYDEIAKGKQTFLPILRYGVMNAPDSFLHCIEKSLNPLYSSLNKKGRVDAIANIRKKMSKMNLAVGFQELYDYTERNIKDMLRDPNQYLDPGMWIRLVEVFYDINIVIFQMDSDHPNGAIVIPRFSQAYLGRHISTKKKSIFIVKNATITEDWPYQCELLIRYDPFAERYNKIMYWFEDDKFTNQIIKVYQETNLVSIVAPEKIVSYLSSH